MNENKTLIGLIILSVTISATILFCFSMYMGKIEKDREIRDECYSKLIQVAKDTQATYAETSLVGPFTIDRCVTSKGKWFPEKK